MISLDKDLNSKPKFHKKFSIINFVTHSLFVNILLVFLCICFFVRLCACLLTADFYVCLLIDIYMVAHAWWDKEVCTVCVRVSWSAPPLACLTSHSTWTKAVHSTCLLTGSHSWAARARGRRGTGQQSVGLNAALGARAHQPETEPRVPGRTCQICCEAPCEGREWAGWLVVSSGFHFLAIERIFSPSAARCCTTSETFLLFPTKFPQHGTQAKSR